MNQNKLNLTQALVVEGKYDAARLANLVDATILTTDGFAIFKDKTMQALFKRIAAAQGMILLTDSDAAGFKIRHFVTSLVGAEHVLQAYVPAIAGKESRKAEPGKEGLLGVEGVSDDLIVQGLETALASKTACRQKTTQSRSITYTDLYDWGISGTANSADRRRAGSDPAQSGRNRRNRHPRYLRFLSAGGAGGRQAAGLGCEHRPWGGCDRRSGRRVVGRQG